MDNKLLTGMIMDGVNVVTPEADKAKDQLDAAIDNQKMKEEILKYKMAHTPIVKENHIGRNDSCPCGSGKKYKNCCLSSGKYEKYSMKK